MGRQLISLVFSAILVSVGHALDFDSPIVGHWARSTSTGAEGLVVSGNYAYLADAQRGVQVIDVSDPTNPRWVAGVPTADYAMNIVWSGNHLYVADRNGGLAIIDVTNPRLPQQVGVLAIPNCYDLDVSGEYAYISRGSAGLAIADVRQRSAPVLAAEVKVPGDAIGVAASATRAYVGFFAGFITVDVTSPSQPRVLSTNAGGFGIRLDGDILYTGRSAWDVSNPDAPLPISNPAKAEDHFYASGGYFGVLHGEAGIELFDISNPSNAVRVGYFSGEWPAAYFSGDYAYMIDRWSGVEWPTYAPRDTGLYVARLKVPANPQRQGTRSAGSAWLREVVVSGNYAYATASLKPPRIYDVRNPSAPVLLQTLDAIGGGQLAISGTRLYCADYQTIRILDISSPPSARVIGTYVHSAVISDLAAAPSNTIYAATWGGFLILDARDPKNVKKVAESPGWVEALHLSGNRLCLATTNGFKVLDVADPHNAHVFCTFTGSSPLLIRLVDDFVYFVVDESQLNIADISEPSSPRLVASIVADWRIGAIEVYDGYVYLASFRGVSVFDVNDPTRPHYVGGNATFNCRSLAGLDTSIFAVGDTFAVLDKFLPLSVAMTGRSSGPDEYTLKISAPPRQLVTMQISSNLVDWVNWERLSITNPPAYLTITNDRAPHTFYRIVWP